jgi:hypothetical protein
MVTERLGFIEVEIAVSVDSLYLYVPGPGYGFSRVAANFFCSPPKLNYGPSAGALRVS